MSAGGVGSYMTRAAVAGGVGLPDYGPTGLFHVTIEKMIKVIENRSVELVSEAV